MLRSGGDSFLTRMFLRDCAYVMRIHRGSNTEFVWYLGTVATGLALSCFALCLFFLVAVVFRAHIPEEFNPLTASRNARAIEVIAVPLLVLVWIDYRFREYKHDLSSARRYMSGLDTVKRFITWLVAMGSLGGMGWFIFIGLDAVKDRAIP